MHYFTLQSAKLIHVLLNNIGLTFNDVLLVPQYSDINSRIQVSLKSQITPRFSIDFPLVAANMDTIVGVQMAIALSRAGSISFYPRFATPTIQCLEVKQILDAGCNVIPSVGIKEGEKDRVKLLVGLGIKILLVDVAHGHQQSCLDFVKYLKSTYSDIEVIAGAVATYEGAKALYVAGADTVKVGVGPGSACTTRIVTGSGMPQLTAIIECARAASEFNRPLMADGGIKNSGDIVKALAAGASFAMSGNLFAGTTETPGKIIEINGKKYKSYNGSASATEKINQYQKNSTEKTADYVKHVEGIERVVECQGSVNDLISGLKTGITSGLSYSGARNITELHDKAQFIQVTSSVVYENNNREAVRP